MDDFRIFKTTIGKPRKNGGCLTKSYGCNGKEHMVTYDLIWYGPDGKATDGQSDVMAPKKLGKCAHDNICKNLGFFRIFNKGELNG